MTLPRILIVEDEANIRASLTEMLNQVGYETHSLENGDKALALLKTKKFDLILLDMNLPDMDGLTVLKQIRQLPSSIPVIILAAYASLERTREALRLGAYDYLFKPCSIQDLQQSIQRTLNPPPIKPVSPAPSISKAQAISPPIKSQPVLPLRPSRFLQQGGLTLDFIRYQATLDDYLLELTRAEFDLLAYLMRQSPRIVSVRELQDQFPETEESAIPHLHQKIKEMSGRDLIKTVGKMGYCIDEG